MPYVINGQQAPINEEPLEREGKNYVPLEPVVQNLGGNVAWDNTAKMATATVGQWTARIQMGNPNVDVSGTPVTLTSPPYVEEGKMYVPWDFFRDAYGYKVTMQNQTLDIHL